MNTSGRVGFFKNLPEPLNDERLWVKTVRYFLAKVGVPITKTTHCKHKGGCIDSTLCKSLRLGINAYVFKFLLSVLFSLKKIIKKPTIVLKLVVAAQNVKFGLFMWLFLLIYKSITCSLRRLLFTNQRMRLIPMIAGFISGCSSIRLLSKSSRQLVALFLFVRALDISLQNLMNKNIISQNKYLYVIIYSLAMSLTGYAYTNEPGCLSPQVNKFYHVFTNEELTDMQMRQIWTHRKNAQLATLGIAPQNPLDFMPKLKDYYLKNRK